MIRCDGKTARCDNDIIEELIAKQCSVAHTSAVENMTQGSYDIMAQTPWHVALGVWKNKHGLKGVAFVKLPAALQAVQAWTTIMTMRRVVRTTDPPEGKKQNWLCPARDKVLVEGGGVEKRGGPLFLLSIVISGDSKTTERNTCGVCCRLICPVWPSDLSHKNVGGPPYSENGLALEEWGEGAIVSRAEVAWKMITK